MTCPIPVSKRSKWRFGIRTFLVLLSLIVVAIVVISCATVDRVIVAPPSIPGATFVGSESCSTCHEDISKDFKFATHSRQLAKGKNAEEAGVGCESCHGPGSLHVESGGKKGTIINPRKSPETCFQCHLDKRAEFSLPHHHPVLEGKMSCADCHNPHKGNMIKGGGTSFDSANETCFQCHTKQRGPFVIQHEAVREGCVTCHKVHGSVNDKMLTERNQNLCLKCHFQTQTIPGAAYIGGGVNGSGAGGHEHSGDWASATCWSSGCHEAIHGSNTSAHLRF